MLLCGPRQQILHVSLDDSTAVMYFAQEQALLCANDAKALLCAKIP